MLGRMMNEHGSIIKIGDIIYGVTYGNELKSGVVESFNHEAGFAYTRDGEIWDIMESYLTPEYPKAVIKRREELRKSY